MMHLCHVDQGEMRCIGYQLWAENENLPSVEQCIHEILGLYEPHWILRQASSSPINSTMIAHKTRARFNAQFPDSEVIHGLIGFNNYTILYVQEYPQAQMIATSFSSS